MANTPSRSLPRHFDTAAPCRRWTPRSAFGQSEGGAVREGPAFARIHPRLHAVGRLCPSLRQRHAGRPKDQGFRIDTNTQAGTNNDGQPVTFRRLQLDGRDAREQIFDVLNKVLNDRI